MSTYKREPPIDWGKIPLEERFKGGVLVTESCHLWTRRLNPNGYGQITLNYKRIYVHRYAYERAHGPIPKGFVIDHLCRNRACVNPAHLEAVTQRENLHRGEQLNFKSHRTGMCAKGIHPLNKDNSINRNDGRLQCKICANNRKKMQRRKVKQ